MKKRKSKELTINGVVLPERWDDHDNVTEVAIETEDGEEYYVEPNERATQLLAFIDSEVEATGIVREQLDGSLTISVERFEAFGTHDDDDDWEEDLDDDDDWEEDLDDEDNWEEDYDDDDEDK